MPVRGATSDAQIRNSSGRFRRLHVLSGIFLILATVLALRIFLLRGGDSLTRLRVPGSLPDAATAAIYREAAELINEVTSTFPDDPHTWNLAGQIHYRFGREEDAEACWQRCLSLDPNFVEAHQKLGYSAAQRGDLTKAAEHYRRACQIDPESSVYPTLLAEVLMQAGRLKEARQVLESLISRQPQAIAARSLLAQILMQLKEDNLAVLHAECVTQRVTDLPNPYHVLATSLRRLGRHDGAQKAQQRFLELKRVEEQTHREQLKTDAPLERLREALGRAYILAGRIFAAHGDFARGDALFVKAAQLIPQDGEPIVLRAWLGRQSGNHPLARQLAEEILDRFAKDAPTMTALAELARSWGEWALARQAAEKVVAARPRDAIGYAILARLCLEKPASQDPFDALALALRATALEPTAENFYLAALCARQANEGSLALAALREAARLSPERASYSQILAAWETELEPALSPGASLKMSSGPGIIPSLPNEEAQMGEPTRD